MIQKIDIPSWIDEQIPVVTMIEVPLQPDMIKPVLQITNNELDNLHRLNILQELGIERLTKKETEENINLISTWIEKEITNSSLQLTEEAKEIFKQMLLLLMKKTDEMVKNI